MIMIIRGVRNSLMPSVSLIEKYLYLIIQVEKKNDEIENLANHFHKKNTKQTYFEFWKKYTDKSKYLRKMD
jgi:hypothetical protein